MNVRVLQQFLDNLIDPLTAARAGADIVADLETINAELGHYADKPIRELAEFLTRAREYEQGGKWPESKPNLAGLVIDDPTPEEYAKRLREALRGELSAPVLAEVEKLKKAMKAPQLKEMASACGVNNPTGAAAKIVEKTFEHLTGRKLPDALLETYQADLIRATENPDEMNRLLEKVEATFNLTQLKKLAKNLNVSETIKSKGQGISAIRQQLLAGDVPREVGAGTSPPEQAVVSEERIARIVDTLSELKRKADPEDAPEDEIDEELRRLEEEMTKEEAIAAAKAFGVRWTMSSKADAMKRIWERVFDAKLIRERIG